MKVMMTVPALVTCFCLSADAKDPTKKAVAPEVVKLLGKDAIAVLQTAEQAWTYRLDPRDYKNPAPLGESVARLNGYRILSNGEKLGKKAIVGKLHPAVLEKKRYLFDVGKLCLFQPGVGLVMRAKEKTVTILLCFSCDQIQVVTRDEKGRVVKQGKEDNDPARPLLLDLAKKAFPKDRVIQNLKAKRP